MLAIRMQRTGRKGYAQFRIVVQDSRQTPSSARVVANVGTYNPHTKELVIDAEKAKLYLKNGAQPSERVISLLKKEGVKLPSWVEPPKKQKKATKNIDKLRKNRPVSTEPKEAKPVEAVSEEIIAEPAEEASVDVPQEAVNVIEPAVETAQETDTVAELAPAGESSQAPEQEEQQSEAKESIQEPEAKKPKTAPKAVK